MIRSKFCLVLLLAALASCCLLEIQASAAEPGEPADQETSTPEKAGGATGQVQPNRSRNNMGAPYVIVDHAGSVLYYLRPSGDVSLDRYVNRRVHVSGRQIALANEDAPLLEVKQIGPPDGAAGPRGARRGGPVDRSVRQASRHEPGELGQDNSSPEGSRPAGDARLASGEMAEGVMTPGPVPDEHMGEHYVDDGPAWDGAGGDCQSCGATAACTSRAARCSSNTR